MMGEVLKIGDYTFTRKRRYTLNHDRQCEHRHTTLNDDGFHVRCDDWRIFIHRRNGA
jgi:hypothetical protein